MTTQGYNHRTTPKNLCIGFISGLVTSEDPKELEAGWKILETAKVLERFYKVYNIYEPMNDVCEPKNIFISKSYDASSHFESTIEDAVQMYERITGEKLDLDTKIQRPPVPGMENMEQ